MPLFHKGQRVGSGPDADRWQVVRKLGEGAFAEVYEVRDLRQDGDARFAMKVEKRVDVRTVKTEYRIMRRVAEHCPQICPVLHGGQLQHDRWYMVMQLLGSNLVELRRGSPGGRLEPRVLRAVAGSMLDALQAVHAAGFIHRDIKPANFSQVPPGSPGGGGGEWRLLDFGLARRYTDDAGCVLPARPDAAFRGSTTYASVHAHAGADLGRRDDLWSWMYCVVELAEGTLPWRQPDSTRDAEAVGGGGGGGGAPDAHRAAALSAKQSALTHPERLARSTPIAGVVSTITAHLASLGFADTPDYGLLRRALAALPDTWPAPGEGATQHLVPVLAHAMAATPPPPSAVIDLTQHAQPPPPALHAWPQAPIPMQSILNAVLHPQQSLVNAWGGTEDAAGGREGALPWDGVAAAGTSGQQQPRPPLPQQQQQCGWEAAGAGGGAGWGEWGGGPPAWHTPPPEGSREASAVSNMAGYLSWMRGGVGGASAEQLAGDLAALHPADGMAVVAAVLGSAVVTTPPSTCNALAALLADVAAYAGHAAQQAGARYAAWHQEQQQQLQQQQLQQQQLQQHQFPQHPLHQQPVQQSEQPVQQYEQHVQQQPLMVAAGSGGGGWPGHKVQEGWAQGVMAGTGQYQPPPLPPGLAVPPEPPMPL